MPVLKAFNCQVEGYDEPSIYHARTASKARAAAWRDIGEFTNGIKFSDITVRRAPAHDLTFPALPPNAATLDWQDKRIIEHAFGGGIDIRPSQWGYRDHYCCDPNEERLLKLVELGIFAGPYGVNEKGETPGFCGAFFYLTDAGKETARAFIGERECGTGLTPDLLANAAHSSKPALSTE